MISILSLIVPSRHCKRWKAAIQTCPSPFAISHFVRLTGQSSSSSDYARMDSSLPEMKQWQSWPTTLQNKPLGRTFIPTCWDKDSRRLCMRRLQKHASMQVTCNSFSSLTPSKIYVRRHNYEITSIIITTIITQKRSVLPHSRRCFPCTMAPLITSYRMTWSVAYKNYTNVSIPTP